MSNTINGRTPEEIKKTIECRRRWGNSCKLNCSECDVFVPGTNGTTMAENALDLINQLERERDAAVEDLETMGEYMAYCDTCLHNNTDHKAEPCSSCMSGYLINNWQWRGVQEIKV